MRRIAIHGLSTSKNLWSSARRRRWPTICATPTDPSCFLIAKGDVADDFAGISLDSDRPAAVVVGGAEENFTYEAMNRAFQFLLAGAELIAIHRNAYWRVGDDLWLDAGAYVAALEFATGSRAKLFGKPSPDFFCPGRRRPSACRPTAY